VTLLDVDVNQRQGILGEDTWELFAVIEESFDVNFGPYEEVVGKTVGELAKCISRESKYPLAEHCISSAVFYRMRRSFLSLFGTAHGKIHPSTELRELFPWGSRRSYWQLLQRNLDLTLPSLTYPTSLLLLSLACAITLGIVSWPYLKSFTNIPVVILCVFAAWLCIVFLLVPFARAFPRSCDTFGDLVRLALARNYAVFASQYGASSEEQILLLLRQLIAGVVSIDVKDIKPETRIPQGLNIE
jgi:hypothetical protein